MAPRHHYRVYFVIYGLFLALVQGPLLRCVGIIASEADERSEGPILALNHNSGAPKWPFPNEINMKSIGNWAKRGGDVGQLGRGWKVGKRLGSWG